MATVNDYTRTTWQTGDVIDATKMNNLEAQVDAITDNARDNGIAAVFSASSTYSVGDFCLYNGELYKCKTKIASPESWTSSHWTRAYLTDAVNNVGSIVARPYSNSSTYAVGDYVTYNGNLYKCKSAIDTAEEWTASHWTQIVMGDEVTDLKSALQTLDGEVFFSGRLNPTFAKEDGNTLTISLPETGVRGWYIKNGVLNKIATAVHLAETIRVPHDSYLVYNPTTDAFISYTHTEIRSNMGDVIICFYNASGYAKGQWGTYYVKQEESEVFNAFSGRIYFYGTNMPSFSYDGNNITCSIGANIGIRGYYYNGDSIVKIANTISTATTVVVAHDSFLIYDLLSNAFEAVSNVNLMMRNNRTDPFVICFINSNGNIKGPWEIYALYDTTNANISNAGTSALAIASSLAGRIGGYKGERPVITQDGTNIKVSVGNIRGYYYNGTRVTTIVKTQATTEYTVPHDNYFVYSVTDSMFASVLAGQLTAENIVSKKYIVLFYNSSGHAKGDWEKYAPDNVTSDDYIPGYYDSHLIDKIGSINQHLSEIAFGTGDAFVFLTDIHEKPLYTVATSKYIEKCTNIDKVFVGGDMINEFATKADALRNINHYYNMYKNEQIQLYKMVGNHEYNNPGSRVSQEEAQLTNSELYQAILKDVENEATLNVDTKTLCYYFDNKASKIRYFVGTCTSTGSLEENTIIWILNQLQDVPVGYDVVIITHSAGRSTNGEFYPLATYLYNGLDAFNDHTTYSPSDTIGGTTYSFDYSSATGKVLLLLAGHLHSDWNGTTTGGIPIVIVTCVTPYTGTGATRTLETTLESAYTVVIIDREQGKAHFVRIGAGNDLTVNC